MGLDNLDRTEKGGLDQQFVVSCNRLINILPGEIGPSATNMGAANGRRLARRQSAQAGNPP